MKKLISIVLPIYKNELNLPVTIPYIMESIPTVFPNYDVELILVNDGSPDNSWEIMKQYREKYPETIKIVKLTRNFGQTMAIHCGISYARGDAIGYMSADMQDPFELYSEMITKWEEGAELICAIRENREEKGISILFSKAAHYLIKNLINKSYPKGGFDFLLMDKKVAISFLDSYRKNEFVPLSLLWLGYKTSFIPYTRQKRENGKSGWTFSKKLKLISDTFVAHSYLPLRVMSSIGVISAFGGFMYACFMVYQTIMFGNVGSGWTSLVVLICFFGGIILCAIGILGEYICHVLGNVSNKPFYLVDQFESQDEEESAVGY